MDGSTYVVQQIHHGPAAGVPPPINLGRNIYDGKRMRKQITRKAVDFTAPAMIYLQNRVFERDCRDFTAIQGHEAYVKDMYPPAAWSHMPVSSIASKYVHTSTNKVRCPVNCVTWTPDGRRLITGSSSGEFTLWNGTTFNFETIQQAHDTAIRAMIWTYSDNWLITGDHGGLIKYFQPNLNNVKTIQAHKEAVRGISFARTDAKFASCSDDVTLKIWDYASCKEELNLTGHGWDIKCVSWHPFNSLVVSGSKDNLIKLWDAKSPTAIATIHAHKNTVTKVHWNKNGNWFLSASRDQLLKVFDVRTMRELQSFKGHKREVTSCAWHPTHETLFVSGDYQGQIMFWTLGCDEPQGEIPDAHDGSVWDLQWHPVGHILCSGSNDHTTKFWCRPRPGDSEKKREEEETTAPAAFGAMGMPAKRI